MKIFTNQYSLSKTLRFELKPVGKTLEHLQKNQQFDPELQTFLKDQEIEDAYQILKPVFDMIHEEFITSSLQSEKAKEMDFFEYFSAKKLLLSIDKKKNETEYKNQKKQLESIEKTLRKNIAILYQVAGEELSLRAGNNEKGKPILAEKGYKVLTESGILKYIKANIDTYAEMGLKTREKISWKTTNQNLVERTDLEKALGTTGNKGVIESFFTYFGGFNQNRENYYSEEDKSTGVANRIINENLPKFTDNIFIFEKYREKYLGIFSFLSEKGNALKNKDNEDLLPIDASYFSILYFPYCLSQREIESYNKYIGNANFLINLYNQRKTPDEVRLSEFKTLYKQIGCGEKKDFIKLIDNADSLKNTLLEIYHAGQKYFVGKTPEGEEKHKIADFIELLLTNQENYDGIYWNKQAINTISGKYFANWYTLASNAWGKRDKKGNLKDEEIKIPEAVELSELFAVLDEDPDANWREEGVFFKHALFEDGKNENISRASTPSEALLAMILSDLQKFSDKFLDNTAVVEKGIVKITDFHNDTERSKIKLWLDDTLGIHRILKYFVTRENKRKGNPQDSEVEGILDRLIMNQGIAFDWFGKYDAVRNYLTKKVGETNKLKLNFENGSLLGGWSDGQEKLKGAVLLKNNNTFYVGILGKKKNLFDTENEQNPVYQSKSTQTGRLILANLKFQTLAGKGFLGEFGISYGEMGKQDPKKAITSLKKIIRDRYVKKYPLLNQIIEKNYSEKKEFDADIQEILKNSYVCEFTPINWDIINTYIDSGDVYIFEISCNSNKIQWQYWLKTFDENSTIQLNGGAEIFYRKCLIEENDKRLKIIKDKDGNNTTKEYIIENKRYTEEKFLFHCPIKINYKAKSYGKPQYAIKEINTTINQTFTEQTNDVCFLGIDRGEKHLAYYSLVDTKGNILEQSSFNTINGHDYHAKLEALSENRDEARKNWQTIGTIKELKNGYISQVVREIVDIAIYEDRKTKKLRKVPAFIVLENLNSGFKNSRKKIEKSIYQKLELVLAKKLNFVVDKEAKNGEILSVQKALQLTPPVAHFSDIEKAQQYGIMLYTRANYTSQTDPVTGWRKSIYLKKGSEENTQEQILEKFDDFGFDGKDYYFIYTDKSGKNWTLYSGKNGISLDRYRGVRGNHNEWTIEKIDITLILGEIFRDFDRDRSYKSQILDEGIEPRKVTDRKETAWESLRFTIDLIQQIRNTSNAVRDNDFLLAPVRDENEEHFDSRKFLDQENAGGTPYFPVSGDANGAYNIARKGIMMFERIKESPEKPQLFISDAEWDEWLQNK